MMIPQGLTMMPLLSPGALGQLQQMTQQSGKVPLKPGGTQDGGEVDVSVGEANLEEEEQ